MSFRRTPMKGIPSGRDALRMMQKMGMNVKEVENVLEVVIKSSDRTFIIDKPNVTIIKMQDQNMFQIVGGSVRDAAAELSISTKISEEDIRLVMEQTGKSIEEAKKALADSDGDLAKAILKLKTA